MENIVNPGGLPYEAKPTDFDYGPIGSASAPFDWTKGYDVEDETGKLYVDDQSPTSCGGHAFSKYVSAQKAVRTDNLSRRSAKFIYNHTAVIQDGSPLGSNIDTNARFVKNSGDALETLCPSYQGTHVASDDFMLAHDITPQATLDGMQNRSKSYAYVPVNMDSFAQAIRDNAGLVILLGGENNGTWYSKFPKPPTYRQWGHFVYAGRARMIDGKRYIGILNSWGATVGENGWQWLGSDYFASGFIEAGCTFVLDLPEPQGFQFTRDLELGMSGLDVQMLQKWLNQHNYIVSSSPSPGSANKETTYYGILTKQAVQRLQRAAGITPDAGFFGPKTRAYVNGHG